MGEKAEIRQKMERMRGYLKEHAPKMPAEKREQLARECAHRADRREATKKK